MDQATKDRLNEFDQYVMNDIPIHLIRLSDMTLGAFSSSKNKDPEEIVKYATLSHQWGEGESAYGTFEEMKKAKLKTPGFEKLKTFCEKVKEYDAQKEFTLRRQEVRSELLNEDTRATSVQIWSQPLKPDGTQEVESQRYRRTGTVWYADTTLLLHCWASFHEEARRLQSTHPAIIPLSVSLSFPKPAPSTKALNMITV
ncbi:hypothetical protein DFH29DRAFT_1000131 [Suillus ampliporus]|nr:hypothetical protein DFH29DRAFT_1000131 [Suillus ampliporus]